MVKVEIVLQKAAPAPKAQHRPPPVEKKSYQIPEDEIDEESLGDNYSEAADEAVKDNIN